MKQISKRTRSQLGATAYVSLIYGIGIWILSRLSHVLVPAAGPIPEVELLFASYWTPVLLLGFLLAQNFGFWKMSDCMPDLGPEHDRSWFLGAVRADFMPFYLYMIFGYSAASVLMSWISIRVLQHLLLILTDAVGLLILAHCVRSVIAAELPRWKTELRASALGNLLQRHAHRRRLPGESLADYYKRVTLALTCPDAKPGCHTFSK